jgi:regulator of CtrA degradation
VNDRNRDKLADALLRPIESALATLAMGEPADITAPIVEALYCDALVLADEARAAFDLSGRLDEASEDEDLARIALSCEALRTTTRMMHVLAWLLNQRAYFRGEMSEFQLRRHGRLPPQQTTGDPAQIARLDPELRDLVMRTQRFYERIARIDRGWRERFAMQPDAIHRLRERLGDAVGAL